MVTLAVTSSASPFTGTLGITKFEAPAVVAPAGVWFEATGISGFDVGGPGAGEIYDPRFHEITFVWSFDDPGSFVAGVAMPTGWNDRNVAYGPKVCHTFDTPGTYTVSVWAIDSSGTKGYAETTVTVVDAATVYTGADTIVVSNDAGETWAGKPTGAAEITSISALQAAINGLTNPTRILFKRGQTWNDVKLSFLNYPVEYIGTWGAGARPIFYPDDSTTVTYQSMFQHVWDTNSLDQFTVDGLDLRGGWDPVTETGKAHTTPFYFGNSQCACHYTLHDLRMSGFNSFYSGTYDGFDCVVITSDTEITNWRDYAVYGGEPSSNLRSGWSGVKVAQNVNALNGGSGGFSYPLSNNEGCFRWPNTKHIYVGVVDAFSRSGWSSLPPDSADQPPFRLNTGYMEDDAIVFDRVRAEGGFRELISLAGTNYGDPVTPGNHLFDKVLLIGNPKGIEQMAFSARGGTTWRNCLAVMQNTPQYHTGNPFERFWNFGPDGWSANNAAAKVNFYNCSGVNLRNATNDLGHFDALQDGGSFFTTFNNDNNVIHAPSVDTPITADAPIDTATAMSGVTPRYAGVEYNFDFISSTEGAIPDSSTYTLAYPAGTDQAYWLAVTSTNHTIYVGNDQRYYTANDGDLTVTFGASNITITNASGETWGGGTFYTRLDRSSELSGLDATYANPAAIPLPRPQSGSAAIDAASTGLVAYDDFLCAVRPRSGGGVDHLGNTIPSGTADRGALQASA